MTLKELCFIHELYNSRNRRIFHHFYNYLHAFCNKDSAFVCLFSKFVALVSHVDIFTCRHIGNIFLTVSKQCLTY